MDDSLEMDLAYLSPLSKYNDIYKCLVNDIDIFTVCLESAANGQDSIKIFILR